MNDDLSRALGGALESVFRVLRARGVPPYVLPVARVVSPWWVRLRLAFSPAPIPRSRFESAYYHNLKDPPWWAREVRHRHQLDKLTRECTGCSRSEHRIEDAR